MELADRQLRLGRPFTSDSSVTEDAARVWESLGRDYTVTKNPTAVFESGAWLTEDGGPVFSLTAKEAAPTAAASTRNDSLPGAILNTRRKRQAAYKRYGLDVSIADDAERAMVAEVFARAERILGENPVDLS